MALSRAQDRLAILGGAKITESNAPSRAIDPLDYIIQSHMEMGVAGRLEADDGEVCRLLGLS